MSISPSSNDLSGALRPPHEPKERTLMHPLVKWVRQSPLISQQEEMEVPSRECTEKVARFELLKQPKRMSQNFGLTETAFEQLVAELQAGNDQLFERIFLKHFEDCVKFITNQYRASWEDAYDASMECLIEFQHRLKAGKIHYGNLRFLFTRMAGQIYLKWIKKEQLKDTMEETFDVAEPPEQLDPELLEVLNMAWEKMCADCKNILKAFYYNGMPLNELAEKLQKKPAAVRKQKQRCLDKLRHFFHHIQ
ncbi:MAG: sigma-70 family RNA polymerase sigma factor [Bacteroidota bacterium]